MGMMRYLLLAAVAAVCMASCVSAKANCTVIKDCKTCVKHYDCFWCESYGNVTGKSKCSPRTTFQLTTDCPKTYYLFPTCDLSGMTLLILVAVALSIVVILIGVIIYCCCCCGSKGSARFRKDDERESTLRTERTKKQDERRAERQTRINDIRSKYGLGTEERYQKM